MMKQKDYKTMTPQEQLDWLTDFQHWTDEKLPVLCALGNAWEASAIKSMEEGLKLISAFGYCRDFVDKSLMFRDFSVVLRECASMWRRSRKRWPWVHR